ncbi:hypothetical protein ACROYT_G015167 [Oculina patagonica]
MGGLPRPSHITTQPTHHSAPNTQSRQSDTEEAHHDAQTSNLPTLNLFVPATVQQKFTTSLDHYNGSNGCTFIALFYSKTVFFPFQPNSINPMQPLNQTLVHHTVSGMLMGNNVYDRINSGIPQMYGVTGAISHLNYMGNVSAARRLMHLSRMPVKKISSYSAEYKLEAIKFAEESKSISKTAKNFNVARKRIREWQRAKDQLQAADNKRKRLEEGGRKPFDVGLEDELLEWVHECTAFEF